MSRDESIWKTKLAAWLHDPAEKALILMRGGSHEEGTVQRLRQLCFGDEGPGSEIDRIVRLADHWASAADRPQVPRPKERMLFADKVRFWGRDGGVLKHPLWSSVARGDSTIRVESYIDSRANIERESLDLFSGLLTEESVGERTTLAEYRSAFLTLWRLGPERPPEGLEDIGHLWRLLPADTRVPDHSIWEHLSLTSAFAGAMHPCADEASPALLMMSLGPVQSFIAQARSVSDLWAGSHLLSVLCWQAMKIVCERYGPDAVVFPSLWGVPIVDCWLEEQGVAFPEDRWRAPEWKRSSSDANPLFAAALPNRFVAVLPADEAGGVAQEIEREVRQWVIEHADEAIDELLERADVADERAETIKDVMMTQAEQQLTGFPELYWSVVPWRPFVGWKVSGGTDRPRSKVVSTETLEEELRRFIPASEKPGFLGSTAWQLLQQSIELSGRAGAGSDDPEMFEPNPGVLYPAIYELSDRLHAAAKVARPFEQVEQGGYRCSLCGEREWLTGDREDLATPPGQRQERKTVWSAIEPGAFASKGEHLCAPCTLKRAWPRVFARWMEEEVLSGTKSVGRFVVSTHTMAVAGSLLSWVVREAGSRDKEGFPQGLTELKDDFGGKTGLEAAVVPLPKKLARALRDIDPELAQVVRRVPAVLDEMNQSLQDGDADAESKVSKARKKLSDFFGHRPETYYGLIKFDGDRMGAWVSGSDDSLLIQHRDAWHPDLAAELRDRFPKESDAGQYLGSKRSSSPARHAAISSALNGFSIHVARWVVEELFCGKLIYAGGDDVLAMLPVEDLLSCLLVLRCAYSGDVPGGDKDALYELLPVLKEDDGLAIRSGFVLTGRGRGSRLLRMMGPWATASAGAVVAHHSAPLQAVLRELNAAERRAKSAGRNAFSVSLMKRSGGLTQLTASFGFGGPASSAEKATDPNRPTALGVLFQLRDELARPGVSRRAAYSVLEWLPDLPAHPDDVSRNEDDPKARTYSDMLAVPMGYHFHRHGLEHHRATELARHLVSVAMEACAPNEVQEEWRSVPDRLAELLVVAEFLAREGRASSNTGARGEARLEVSP